MSIAKVGDINIEYYVEGEGPPLLLIIGFAGQASSWGEPFLDLLRPHFQVIRFSNRGTGLTDKPDAEYTIPMMADDAAGLLVELGIGKAHVMGISMGCTSPRSWRWATPSGCWGWCWAARGAGRHTVCQPSPRR